MIKRLSDAATWTRRELVAQAAPRFPERVRSRLLPDEYNWSIRDMQTFAQPKDAPIRLLIAPANYASQGYFWARAAETLPGVSATNLRFLRDGLVPTTPSDFDLKGKVGKSSHLWARKQRRVIHSQFTHVLIEASRPILGALYDGDLVREVQDYMAAGIKVGFVSHGSDTRLPSLHRSITDRSPFYSDLDGLTQVLEDKVRSNYEVLDSLGLPEFIPTPELRDFRPGARWLPLLADSKDWASLPPPSFSDGKLKVLHVPSRQPALKGSHAIRPALRKLHDEGLIEYVELGGIPYGEMPSQVSRAQVVVNQVDMGLYATAAVEAMYAGRLVVADVWQSVRDFIKQDTGWDLPIVQADGNTVYDVVKHIALHLEQYEATARQGKDYALSVHSQKKVADTLSDFLLS